MAEATLNDVLAARERRVEQQQKMLRADDLPLISFTLNIAGPVKDDAWARYAFTEGRTALKAVLVSFGYPIRAEEETSSPAGFEWMAAVDARSDRLKSLCVSIEEGSRLGRLFDMDVIDRDGLKIPRTEERTCLVCGKPGRGCASRRLHPLTEIRAETIRIIQEHRVAAQSERMASQAVQSLLDEVCTTPKPGLVDRCNNGSHRDMDIFTFNASAAALWPYFQRCFLTGAEMRKEPAADVFLKLQHLGLEAERTMLRATGGVNTHKGAIFTLGLMCGAAGRTLTEDPGEEPVGLTQWLTACAELAQYSVSSNGEETHGDRILREYGVGGIRRELSEGLPSVEKVGLPALQKARQQGMNLNDSCVYTLLALIAAVQDTNMIARGGVQLAEEARQRTKALLERAEKTVPDKEELDELERFFMLNRLSPGGCADLLAATLLADRHMCEQESL